MKCNPFRSHRNVLLKYILYICPYLSIPFTFWRKVFSLSQHFFLIQTNESVTTIIVIKMFLCGKDIDVRLSRGNTANTVLY